MLLCLCCCTDVIVQCIVFGSWSIRTSELAYDMVMPFWILDVVNPLDTFVSHFFSFSSGIVSSILSHICGRLYFPMFLFRVGLLTLMNMASLMVLAILFSSLPRDLKIVHRCYMATGSLVMENWRRCLHMLLDSSPKVLPDSPTYSSSQPSSPQQ